MKTLFLAIVFALSATMARADQPAALDDAAIGAAVSGRDFAGVYADGSAWRETYAIDGTITYVDDETEAWGKWRAVGGRLCTLYAGGVDGGCFLMVRRGENCFDFYAVRTEDGLPEASDGDIAAGRDWTAQGWDASRQSTCPVGDVT